ncbi:MULTISPECIES: flavin prenyltransferase UbiX [unclassified Colwellia]|uniref:flavin prenyltransferase UbiX n=1 Tax=unclassified Colwellia TaxID=196834 RepID=UPI0015F48768|nr:MULTISPECIES: flavin prenyltransferase UbiX [unclassified Colwellia]MBA6232615.1 UbiX family flavin prenyltransferase [Colwellia sp. MB02u-7]MBA6235244.1 UbiX family flavin prenyltransferase [Colwellia sp. MB02u-11]MBA6257934.1 UbiX family flavin prenyltransferase [Colwellia sp. MB3u-28]MBA6258386.1 UbiX family flavin prenyltransferase [Colwellia sp. MB3u-41]MBA6299294.1 UbiX family flavin prenyltransferase [Colwellia sp. MB3u-22]
MHEFREKITVAITGASGAPYALRLIECLVAANVEIYVLCSSAARVVLDTEVGVKIPGSPDGATQFLSEKFKAKPSQITVFGKEQWFSPVASGSAAPKKMIVCPCSTGTLAAITLGMSDNLIERAADVVIKERGQLILVVRESPFSTIHLQNMLTLSQMGVTIMPAAPGFYHHPQSINDLIDFMVGRMLDHLSIEQSIIPRWGYQV